MKFLILASAVSIVMLTSCSKKQDDQDAIFTSGYKVVAVTGGGSVKGSVRTQSNQLFTSIIETKKDQDVCGESHRNPAAITGDGAVPNCILMIESITQGKEFTRKESTLDQHGCDTDKLQLPSVEKVALCDRGDGVRRQLHSKN